MSHYDGPAFYRKLEQLKRSSKRADNIIDAKPDDVEDLDAPHDTLPKPHVQKPVETNSTKKVQNRDLQQSKNNSTSIKVPTSFDKQKEDPVVTEFRDFARTHVVTYHHAISEQRFYAKLLATLKKAPASYYLLDSFQSHDLSDSQIQYITSSAAKVAPKTDNDLHSEVVKVQHESNDVNKSRLQKPRSTHPRLRNDPFDKPIVLHGETAHGEEIIKSQAVRANAKLNKAIDPLDSTHSQHISKTPQVASNTQAHAIAEKQQALLQQKLVTHQHSEILKSPTLHKQANPTTTPIKSDASAQNVNLTQKITTNTQPSRAVGPTYIKNSNSNDYEQVSDSFAHYQLPSLDLLPQPVKLDMTKMSAWADEKTQVLDETLQAFHVAGKVQKYTIGPSVSQFEISLERGVKVSKITNLNDDLKLALAAKEIRIEAPIPGRSTVGIEIPNPKSRPVYLSEVLGSKAFQDAKSPLTVALGVNLFGQPVIGDIAKMPHALIAGSTGSGKSVFINSLLTSILYKAKPDEVKLILIDPKVVELAPYNGLPHLLTPVISDPQEASAALQYVVKLMDKRYKQFAAARVRDMSQFNALAQSRHHDQAKMPYIVVIIDELADLMMTASNDVQDSISRITAKARAAGIHLIVATQRPSVDVVTGTIKNNIATRIAFSVSSQIDSRTILDTSGAERLQGKGDMLYLGSGQNYPLRLQGTYIENEVDQIVAFVKQQVPTNYVFKANSLLKRSMAKSEEDAKMPEVLDFLAQADTISTSKLQRVFGVGYNRAARIIDELEAKNYIGQAQGSSPRKVYFDTSDLENLRQSQQ